jgi:glycosyltransferase involved in cell wall biosynthesis
MGVPVVGSRIGGVPEVIAHGVTGLLAEAGDVEAMTRAALELLGDPVRRRAMGEAARRRAVGHFEMRTAIDRYEAVYLR